MHHKTQKNTTEKLKKLSVDFDSWMAAQNSEQKKLVKSFWITISIQKKLKYLFINPSKTCLYQRLLTFRCLDPTMLSFVVKYSVLQFAVIVLQSN